MKVLIPLRLLALAAFLVVPFARSFAAETQRPQPTEKRVYKEIGDTRLEVWIWKPADWQPADRRSAIVFYHGGGWRNGSPTAFSRQSEKLAARGMVAVSVQYRLTSKAGVTVVDCVKDAKSAFRWVRAHAAELGVDPEKIAAGGGSAGGHLAASLVTLDAVNDEHDDLKISTRPSALVLFNPALRLGSPREKDAVASAPSRASISPYEHLKRGHPPTIIFHGEDDTTVPIASVRDYAAKAENLGADCKVIGFPGAAHSFFNREPHVWDTLKQAEAFLEKHELLPPARTAAGTTSSSSAAAAVGPAGLASARLLGVRRTAAPQGANRATTPPDGLAFAVLVAPTTDVSSRPAIKEARDVLIAGESYREKTRAALGKSFEPQTVFNNADKFLAATPALATPGETIAPGSFVLAITYRGAELQAGAPVELTVHAGFDQQPQTFVLRTKVPPTR